MSIIIDTSAATALGARLAAAGVTQRAVLAKILRNGSDELVRQWRANAQTTAGRHGKHYPNSIDSEWHGALEVEVGPNPAKPQGGMSFEYGSVNQPPHLDGQKAADAVEPKIEAMAAEMIAVLLGGL